MIRNNNMIEILINFSFSLIDIALHFCCNSKGIHFIERKNRMYIVALSMGIVLALSAILMILEVLKKEFFSTKNEVNKKMQFPPPYSVLCSSEYL
jgi:magnesium-transporting ATPase (P-type)